MDVSAGQEPQLHRIKVEESRLGKFDDDRHPYLFMMRPFRTRTTIMEIAPQQPFILAIPDSRERNLVLPENYSGSGLVLLDFPPLRVYPFLEEISTTEHRDTRSRRSLYIREGRPVRYC